MRYRVKRYPLGNEYYPQYKKSLFGKWKNFTQGGIFLAAISFKTERMAKVFIEHKEVYGFED